MGAGGDSGSGGGVVVSGVEVSVVGSRVVVNSSGEGFWFLAFLGLGFLASDIWLILTSKIISQYDFVVKLFVRKSIINEMIILFKQEVLFWGFAFN